ncbi:hypothetical protein ABEB36_010668 [Hypothenemus hampei]|uniref:Uncharacterized protein n=1 Tax=Hypothenemus hampei TaxID=57062 RepID=A0ABD1EGZ6_HYPHA
MVHEESDEDQATFLYSKYPYSMYLANSFQATSAQGELSNLDLDKNENNTILTLSHETISNNLEKETVPDGDNNPNEKELELRKLLTSWQLEQLVDHFLAERVYISVLKVIKTKHVDMLMSNFPIGVQVMFDHHFEIWRNEIGLPLHDLTIDNLPISNSVSRTPSRSSTPSSRETFSSNQRFLPYCRPSTSDDYFSLGLILNETSKGAILCDYYDKKNKFEEEQRNMLVALIATFYEDKSTHMSLAASYRLEKEILERFPTEKIEFYRTSKRGKIYNKVSNMKTSMKSLLSEVKGSNKLEACERKSRIDEDFEPEIDAESCLRCLKFDNLSAEEFDSCWRACSKYRLTEIKNTAEIFNKWYFYKQPSGYRLIDIDFKVAFHDRDGLLDKWETYFHPLLDFLTKSQNLKDKKCKSQAEYVKKNLENISENGRSAAILHALHGYLVPTKVFVNNINNKKNVTRFTIRDSQEAFLIMGDSATEIEEKIRHLKTVKTSIQPFIYGIGKDIFSLQQIGLYFDDVRFEFKNFIRAVDLCYKIMYLFNLDFPQEAGIFYSFIEMFFYEFKSNISNPKIHILMNSLRNA